jgi:Xaa-Pro aminopeptidase
MTEFSYKQKLIRNLIEEQELDGLILQRVSSFAWATCGAASYVNTATSNGAATLLITSDDHHLITNNIEATRLEKEEKLFYQGWEFHISPWYKNHEAIANLTRNMKLGADSSFPGAKDLSVELAHLRCLLTPEEDVRFRVLGRLCAEAMDAAIRCIQPGQTEHQIAAFLSLEAHNRGLTPIVNLVATDERIDAYRHPLPTFKTLGKYAMLILCGRRWGLVASITRLIHFGPLPDEIREKAEAVARIDAQFISTTRPGASLGQIFQQATSVYREVGYPDEWMLHHQGGPAGYEPREYLATPDSLDRVALGQVYAWNPSITGVKSEDSIQIGESNNEIITEIAGWPSIDFEVDGQIIRRPAILQVD